MRRMSVPLAAAALLAAPAFAAEPPAPLAPTPGEQAKQGVELLLKALEGWIRQLPSYAPPEVTPEGDIIIRRLDRNRAVPPGSPPLGPPDPGTPPGGATNL
ncbi:hypothetical protein [Azospirillum sp.]|uniref:hypothetical protein n=1 Tax=Azospirillum sp. TaxID=34012 RepID=UPI003D74CE36